MEHLNINLYQYFEKIISILDNFNGIIYLVHIDHEGGQTYRHTVHCPNPSENPVHTANHGGFCWNKATYVSHIYYQSYLQYTCTLSRTLLTKLKKVRQREISILIRTSMIWSNLVKKKKKKHVGLS